MMKRIGILFVTTVIGASSAAARNIELQLARSYSEQQTKAVMESIGSGLMPNLAPNDTISVKADGRTLAETTIPSDEKYAKVPKFRNALLQPAWTAAAMQMKTALEVGQGPGHLDFVGVLSSARYQTTSDRDVVVFGSPLLSDPRMPEWSLAAAWPNDAVFGLQQADSPYGTAGSQQLGGTRFHYCVTPGVEYVNLAHQKMTERAISLLVKGYGGVLATFTDDLSLCIKRALMGATDGALVFERDPTVTTPRMLLATNTLVGVPSLPAEQAVLVEEASQDPKVRADLLTMLAKRPQVRLGRVYLSDDRDEDGDVVAFDLDGIRLPVTLTHEEREAVAVIEGGRISIYAVKDGGGGGVTVRIRTEDNQITSPVLSEGERFDIDTAAH